MTWASPWAFVLLIPLIVILIYLVFTRRQRQPSLLVGHVALFRQINRPLRAQLLWLPPALKAFGVALAILALARPQRADIKTKRNVEGIDIVIALDISDSMLIEDLQPINRLEASKKTIRDFISQRVSDRIGLVVFAGESYTRVPMTLDYPVLLQSVASITTGRNIKMGTAIGVALANAAQRLKDSVAKSRVIIFLTDGENNSGTIDPETALDIAKDMKLKIYSIGMGKDGDAQLPVEAIDPFGRKVKTYRPMHSKVNDELLGKFASDTGGKYYRATTGHALEGVFADINKLEKTKIETNTFTRYEELFPQFLLAAMILYLAGLILQNTLLRRGP